MGEREPRFTPALEDAARRREELHDALVDVEAAISHAAVDRRPAWTADVDKALLRLREAFGDHVLGIERPGGLHEEVLERAPRLARKLELLHEEHVTILERLDATIERLRGDELDAGAWPVDEVRDDVQRILGAIVRHRQVGADLVYEAYFVDIGGME